MESQFCFLEAQDIRLPHKETHNPVVELLLSKSKAQSESEKLVRVF